MNLMQQFEFLYAIVFGTFLLAATKQENFWCHSDSIMGLGMSRLQLRFLHMVGDFLFTLVWTFLVHIRL